MGISEGGSAKGWNKNGPVYKHHCGDCVYLLTLVTPTHGMVDAYSCKWSIVSGKTFRFSDEPSDYTALPDDDLIGRFFTASAEAST